MDNPLRYEELAPVSHAEAESAFASGDDNVIARVLIALGLHDSDWKWVQQQAIRSLHNSNSVVVSAAILSIAHSARVNGRIDLDKVGPALRAIACDSRYTGKVQDALDDIEIFVKQ